MGARPRAFLFPIFALLTLTSCVDEEIVFRDRELFEDPAAGALGFLGYSDQEAGLQVCGNCHVGQQGEWEETAHASAWEGLQSSGHASASCEGCHTVNQLGNTTEQAGGWLAVPDERYHDVGCESCHGPGLAHVENPDADANHPLAPISVGLDLTLGCGECHQGTHHPFVEEWEQSAHATPVASAAGRAGCDGCHEGKAILTQFGVKADYLEKGSSELMGITCSVCHDPHDNTYEGQLRFPVVEATTETHLCARCHDRRTAPDPTSSHGLEPHSPETALLAGDAGWFPPNLPIDQGQIIATHGSEANPGLCATCHVNRFEVTDQETGEFVFQATGHLFQAIPCVDEQGVPTAGDCALSTEARSFQGCTASGCHGNEQAAFSALVSATNTLRNRAEELHDLLLSIDPNGSAAGGAVDATDGVFSVGDGAWFNLELAEFGGRERASPLLTFAGAAAHNPFLMEALLVASIEAVEDEYGVSASPGFVRSMMLKGHPLPRSQQ